jgi:DNA-binding MarR family transcriptional regulator
MSIHKDIQQENFKSVYQKMMINILYTSSWFEDNNAAIMRDKKLSITQFNVLRILRGSHPKPCTGQDIQERMINKRSDVTRLIERLRKTELVTREVCPENRRKVDILITNKGLQLLHELDPVMEASSEVLKKLSEEEAEQLSSLLDKLRS